MAIAFSKYQSAVLDWVEQGSGSAIVVAVAGSGKTFTIEHALTRIPEHAKVAVFAFNTTIAKELNARLDKLRREATERGDINRQYRNVRASTFHSVGFGAICRHLGKRANDIHTDGSKTRKLCDQWLGDVDAAVYGEFICKLVGLARGEGVGVLIPNTQEQWYRLIQHHDLYLDSEDADETRAIELAQDLLDRSNKAAAGGYIDFDDMLYLPLLWRLRLFQNDWLLVDEAQDTNPVRRAIAKLALRPGGRAVFVGDPRQAIYGFTGASTDALDIIRREFNAVEMPLSVCYRCGTSIVAKAREIVDHIEPHDAAPEGKVETLALLEALKVLGPHDAVLCRKNAPLVSLAFKLIAQKRGCVILGRDIGQGLVSLIKKMKVRDVDALEQKLQVHLDREYAKFMSRGEEQKAEAVSDRVACIRAVIENLDEDDRTVAALIASLENMFRDTNGVLTLSSVHKSKGREWERVAILEPENMPSPFARQDWQREAEENLRYVAFTRAMQHLIFLTP